jgi:heme/copper-type cytochrome/quinol oxidase subunit 3
LAMWLFLGSECLLFGGLAAGTPVHRGRPSCGTSP